MGDDIGGLDKWAEEVKRQLSAAQQRQGVTEDDYRPEAGLGYVGGLQPGSVVTDPTGHKLTVGGGGEYFQMEDFARGQGFQATTPAGARFPETQSWDAFAKFIEKEYGMSPEDFVEATEEERYESWARGRGAATEPSEIPTGPSGMPTRPPKSPEEAALFQWWAGEQSRERNEELLRNAVATMQYAFGLLRQGGPGSLAAFQSPHLTSLAQMYHTTEYGQPDYSYWMMPEAFVHGVG